MTWKSRDIVAEQLERPGRPAVVEGHERVVEDERRAAIAGDEPDEPEAGGQVDEVERALAERPDVDPVALLRRAEPDVRASCRRPHTVGSGRP